MSWKNLFTPRRNSRNARRGNATGRSRRCRAGPPNRLKPETLDARIQPCQPPYILRIFTHQVHLMLNRP